jgi:hypothetical protein
MLARVTMLVVALVLLAAPVASARPASPAPDAVSWSD